MSFCVIGKEYVRAGYTQIDNLYLGGYLPQADAVDVKVYLYGLYLAGTGDLQSNSLEKMSYSLKLTEARILQAYRYWEDQGLVTVSATSPAEITYLSVKLPMIPVIKVNAREYSTFVEEMARLFPEKILSENEIMSYIELMRTYRIDTNAMLMICRYCMNAKATAGTPYILAVATDWAKQGINTEEYVSNHIAELERHHDGLAAIYSTLGLKSTPALEERQDYLKWTKDYGFTQDALLTASRACKRKGGYAKLARYLDELHSAGALTSEEIDAYSKRKDDDLKLAEDVSRNIGLYFGSYETVVETYITPWLMQGFEPDALKSIAKYCLVRNIHSLEGMKSVSDKFYKLGILTSDGIAAYIQKQVDIDRLIKEVLERTGSSSLVTNRDRDFYKTFVELWGFSHEAILTAADGITGSPFAMASLNRTLAMLKNARVFDPEEIKAFLASAPAKRPSANGGKASEDYEKREYTKEELNAVSHSLDDLDDMGGEF